VTVTEDRSPVTDEPAAPARRSRRRWLWVTLLALGAVTVLTVLSAGFGRDPSVVDSVLLDGPAPLLAGPTLDGGSFDLADYRGKVVLVNVWASWCAPCRDEYPLLEAAQRELSPAGLQVVGIDTQDSTRAAQRFLDEMGGENFPNVLDPDGRKTIDWGAFGVPETYLVDRDGTLVAKQVCQLSAEWIATTVVPLLEGEGTGP